jgi:FtsP/CotA-like multicopper oxidase with cupredoxin domain
MNMNLKSFVLLTSLALLPLHFAGAQTPAPAADGTISGKVAETMTTAGYTYVLVDDGSKKVWAAAVQFEVKVGDSVSFSGGAPMQNFHSKTLNRDFDLVYFTGGITVNAGGAKPQLPPGHPALNGGTSAALPPGHPALTAAPTAAPVDLTGIKKAAGGKTIAEIFSSRAKLAGKTISVRGKIVKYNAGIMEKNWLHIQDGSGSADNSDNDLAVTTTTAAKVGDTVLVMGVVATDKDFGAGYKYRVILDGATVTVE